ncbi:TspO/MBR family protein [uncultured Alsobacter sp.]|uniref:TspO/MBR family protein n=1 Tax=uncultured Alsobacter sp. TaxID=1748258 RepID=UPI0025FC9ACC|nr:TspO/MBR family protein [uncultured Alsobacter sp.]
MSFTDGLGLAGFVVACVLAASSGAIFRPGTWYDSLRKPSWRPPNWLFGPAWTVLYILIAVAGWMVWKKAGLVSVPIAIYAVQLVLNATWSGLFFGMRRMDLAFAELVLLWLSIAATIWTFQPVDQTAAWLLVPYLCWVTFAGALNFTVWRLNPQAG